MYMLTTTIAHYHMAMLYTFCCVHNTSQIAQLFCTLVLSLYLGAFVILQHRHRLHVNIQSVHLSVHLAVHNYSLTP